MISHAHETPIMCNVSLEILRIFDIKDNQQTITLEILETLAWKEDRFLFNDTKLLEKRVDHIHCRFDSILMKQIWTPTLSYREAVSISYPMGESNDLVYAEVLWPHSFVSQQRRFLLQINCNFDFKYYPADTQICHVTIGFESRGINILNWIDWRIFHFDGNRPPFPIPVLAINMQENNYEFEVVMPPYFERMPNELMFQVRLRRKISYHLLQTYFLSCFFVMVTLLCYFTSADMLEIRVAIGMGTLLSITSLFSSIRGEVPAVAYIKAIDIWMFGCIGTIFAALSTFTYLAWLKKNIQLLLHQDKEASSLSELTGEGKDEAKILRLINQYKKSALSLDYAAPRILSAAFIIFKGVYWTWLILGSQYFSTLDGNLMMD